MISMPRSAAIVRGVHRRHAGLEDRLEQSDQNGVDDHVVAPVGQVAVVADAERIGAAVVHLREERSEAFAELDEGPKPDVFLRRHRREVHCVSDDAVLEEVTQRRGGFDADEFLSLACRGGDMRRGDDLWQLLEPLVWGRF